MIKVKREREIAEIPDLNTKVKDYLFSLLSDESDSIYIFGISEESGIPCHLATNSEEIVKHGLEYVLFIYDLPEFTVDSDDTILMLQDRYYKAWITPMYEITKNKIYEISTTGTYDINARK